MNITRRVFDCVICGEQGTQFMGPGSKPKDNCHGCESRLVRHSREAYEIIVDVLEHKGQEVPDELVARMVNYATLIEDSSEN